MLTAADNTISRILDDVLSLQKIEDGAFELHFSSFPIRSIVDDVARSFRPAAAAKGLDLQVECDQISERSLAHGRPTLPFSGSPASAVTLTIQSEEIKTDYLLEGDIYRLHQVLSNFVSNGRAIAHILRGHLLYASDVVLLLSL